MDSFLSFIAISFVFGVLKWSMPYKKRVDIDELKLAQNAKKYNRYELLSLIPLFVYMFLVPYLFYLLGTNFLSDINREAAAIVFYATDVMIWPVVGLFFAFGTIMLPMNKLYEFLLKEEYDLYVEHGNRKYGFDALRIWKPFSYVLIFMGGIVMFLAMNTYFKVNENKVVVNHFFSMQPTETHFYDLGRIVLYQKTGAPNGNIVNNKHFVIYKKDDTIILDESFKFFGVQESTVNYLLSKCKLTLERENLRIESKVY